jgi:acyl-coenzyme A thioesterase PaaI-like protein
MRPAEPGKDLRSHAVCYRVTRSIAFVRATAYQDDPAKPIASAAAAFMIAANRTNMMAEQKPKITYDMLPPLAVPDEPTAPELAQSSYARFLGIQVRQDGTTIMPYHVKLTGNPILPALHGGTIGSFLETTAVVGVAREIGADMQPKPVGLTINYLRSGKSLDTFARVKIVKQGRRVVAFEAQAWQTSPSLPIASAYGHFMLKKEPGADA